MNIGFFSAKKYDEEFFNQANKNYGYKVRYFDFSLTEKSVVMASEFEAICVFVNDRINKNVLDTLSKGKTKYIAFRCAGYNNIDLQYAQKKGFRCVRVPAYSPNAVAEHVLALLLTLYRSTHKAYNRVREGNFSLTGLSGEEIFGKTVGIVGTGNIGSIVANIFNGLGCEVIASDPVVNQDLMSKSSIQYVDLEELYQRADIITLHCPLTNDNRHMIDSHSIQMMKRGVTLVNTGRGGLINTQAVYEALKSKHIGYLAIDVYEEEASLFFEDLSTDIIMDDLFMRLTTFPNVLITGHQGFFTKRALKQIAETTLENLKALEKRLKSDNEIF
ncbi:2-hydroxyacid dehydrogenase [Pleionea sediminis]|uniref:2-hydroxyacid dehydrogenase n=1 Tax=Pleionea sediminis TaxID=2569479 RepID=UPI001185DF36|nr:2-hydroxyacid dehydrogenase [Pleionea sediminis]